VVETSTVVAGQELRTVRIGIVDDHPVFRLGLKRALERESDFDITWDLGSASNIDAQMRRAPVDLILMDLYMGNGKDGFAATRDVVERWPGVKIVVISASTDERNALASTRAGADGFLPKAMPVSEMVKSIRRVALADVRGRRTGNTATERRASAKKRSTPPRKPKVASRVGGLSRRQRQVLDELRRGRTNREIAEHMGISIATVNKHVHEVLKILKVRNRTEAAAVARTLQE
jgi:two-component system nitrate/nitrite response regulator NarL